MDTSLNAKCEHFVTGSSVSADANTPDQMLRDLACFTETLSCGLPSYLDETKLSNAVADVERTIRNLHRWVEKSDDESLKRKVASGVSAALKSICTLGHSVDRASESNLRVISRVLDVGDRLLKCHAFIKNQIILSSAG